MPRDRLVRGRYVSRKTGRAVDEPTPDWALRLKLDWAGELDRADVRDLPEVLERFASFRLFSLATRHYLRRRAWRYFRRLGREHPGRYVAAASEALALYRDEDAADVSALLDNWGLVHILFHHAPALRALPSGWTARPGRLTGGLAPAPIFEDLWAQSPGVVAGLLARARSTTVRRWALRLVEADPDLYAPALPLDAWSDLLEHDDPEVAGLAARMLDESEGPVHLGVDRWLALIESTDPSALGPLCDLVAGHVDAGRVTAQQAARLASLRPLPAARLGLTWLQGRAIGPEERDAILPLLDARCEPLRPAILEWLRRALADSPGSDPSMILEFLQSRHLDARREGWDWFRSDPKARDDPRVWGGLLDSPHPEVRLALVAELEECARAGDPADLGRVLDPEALRRLWASALLDVARGARSRPVVVGQVVRRLESVPGEAADLLPLLGLALRSVRAPERLAALGAIVRLVEGRAELAALVRSSFPELQIA